MDAYLSPIFFLGNDLPLLRLPVDLSIDAAYLINMNDSHHISPYVDMDARSREIFRVLVETYLDTGEPVGSRTLSKDRDIGVSAATIRNVLQDLEQHGLLDAPHTSAGRLPTHQGLRLFVDAMMEVGDISTTERTEIEKSITAAHEEDDTVQGMLDQAGSLLSGLSHCASLVLAPKTERPVKHVDFVGLNQGRALVVMVMEDGTVENRVFTPPSGLTPAAMQEASNFLNAQLRGRTLSEAMTLLNEQLKQQRREINETAQRLVEAGLAAWANGSDTDPSRLIVRGRSNLLDSLSPSADKLNTEQDLHRIRMLFDDMERKADLSNLLNLAQEAEGVRIFIGAENQLFSLSGSSLIISPYMDSEKKIIGAIGVIGPTRLNYGRVVPIVDYTARLIGRALTDGTNG